MAGPDYIYQSLVVHGMHGCACFLDFSIEDIMVVVSTVSLNIHIQILFELKFSFLWDKCPGVSESYG